jgi:phosphoribosylaminoimidazolecarboxamide formyltransferase/IMP cyclohydrolase
MFKNALISVSDKTGLVEFLKPFVAQGMRVVSTGGTLKHLRENGIQAIEVSEQTGFPEVMDGRVKTLHPRVHMPLLARLDHPEDVALLKKEKLDPFDLVIVNLYPFEEARARGLKGEELIEFIDIGGPSLLRAAAKSSSRLAVVCEPSDYAWIAEKKGALSASDRLRLAARVFSHTSKYDDLIAKTLAEEFEDRPKTLVGRKVDELRYGENSQQRAWWMRDPAAAGGLHNAEILHGKALSYNNLLDLDAAVGCLATFNEPAAVAVKHNNPCGVGVASAIAEAVDRSVLADPVSVFGGIIAINREVDLRSAEILSKIFLECVIAPSFSAEALEKLKKKKDLRLLAWPALKSAGIESELQYRSISGGFLVQTADVIERDFSKSWKIIGEQPTPQISHDLCFAWQVCARLKSNAIAIAASGKTLGLGMGQVNRVDAVEQAIGRMKKHHDGFSQAVLASDAFFPFPDSIELAAKAGIRWIIQPGGSIRDEEVIAKAKEFGVNQVLTGQRHFRH